MTSVRRRRTEPRTHWALLVVLLATLTASILLAALIHGQVGESAANPVSRALAGQVPAPVLTGGPVVDAARADQPGQRVAEQRVALTFDDGPSPYTGAVLDVLAAHHAHATFFVIGARAADQPELLRRMYAEGHEVGVHTFTHVNVADVGPQRLRTELDQTQLAVAAATGRTTNLIRLPYSSTVGNLTYADWTTLREMRGYRAVFTDLDTEDWAQPGAASIAARALPADGKGAVVMLHDGGGDRTETVAALDIMLTQLEQRGYTADTLSQAIGAPSAWLPATPRQQLQGRFVSSMVQLSTGTVTGLKVVFLALAALAVLRTLLLVGLAHRHRRTPVLA